MSCYRDEFGDPLTVSDRADLERAAREDARTFEQWELDNPVEAAKAREATRRALARVDAQRARLYGTAARLAGTEAQPSDSGGAS